MKLFKLLPLKYISEQSDSTPMDNFNLTSDDSVSDEPLDEKLLDDYATQAWNEISNPEKHNSLENILKNDPIIKNLSEKEKEFVIGRIKYHLEQAQLAVVGS